jgi:hypothetical protein
LEGEGCKQGMSSEEASLRLVVVAWAGSKMKRRALKWWWCEAERQSRWADRRGVEGR